MSCKNCEKRTIDCHVTCEEYKAYKAKLAAENKNRHIKKQNIAALNSLEVKRGKRRKNR